MNSLDRSEHSRADLHVAICNFGWGSVGKFKLILDHLSGLHISLANSGSHAIDVMAQNVIAQANINVARPVTAAKVGLVINSPRAAEHLSQNGCPVIYVDSLPYLWMRADEIPSEHATALYCAQKFPLSCCSVYEPLRDRKDLVWIDPIVPADIRNFGGDGIVINVGGMKSHIEGNCAEAYLSLVLEPLVNAIIESGQKVSAICGDIPVDLCARLVRKIGSQCKVGAMSPGIFLELLATADMLITSPGSTTILQAASMNLPTQLLPPQNLSQVLNASIYTGRREIVSGWPSSVMSYEHIEGLRSQGEEAVVSYMYECIARARRDGAAQKDVTHQIKELPIERGNMGVLDPSVHQLGNRGAKQVAQFIRQALKAPFKSEPWK